jgi:excinuclease UvrABC ATPase subunit
VQKRKLESAPFGNIEVHGAREDNLKNISVDIPRRRITVFTGVSGSGKSSLVFDTIAAESQRLLNETFSTFVQNFLPRYGQPDVDVLANLSTATIVDQQRIGRIRGAPEDVAPQQEPDAPAQAKPRTLYTYQRD